MNFPFYEMGRPIRKTVYLLESKDRIPAFDHRKWFRKGTRFLGINLCSHSYLAFPLWRGKPIESIVQWKGEFTVIRKLSAHEIKALRPSAHPLTPSVRN